MGLLAASLATAATMGWLFLRSTKLKDSAMTPIPTRTNEAVEYSVSDEAWYPS
jgi:hypothetical protein